MFTIIQNLLYLEYTEVKMAKKHRREAKDTDYVNNKKLRELVIRYNDLNPNDTGEWLDKFEKTMKTKGKLPEVKDWIKLRRKKYAEKRECTAEYMSVSRQLFNYVYKIVRGRVACFQGIPVDEREDVIQDCVLAVTQYINRYREDKESSAFAYLTQIISNALKLHMGNDNDSRWCRVPWNELSNDHISLMYGVEEQGDANAYED